MLLKTCLLAGTLLTTTTLALLNGTTTTNPFYAFTAAIFQPALIDYSSTFICTGVLISPTTILTLAECINGLGPSDLQIRLGTCPLDYINSTVNSITLHPDFSIDTLENDMAVLKLDDAVTSINPVTISATPVNETSDSVYLLGWGPSKNGTQEISTSLRGIAVESVDQDSCARDLKACFNLSRQHFCTRTDLGVGEAYGDFGGPVLNAKGELVGLISGNPVCAAAKGLALEVRVEEVKEWIGENV